MNKVIINEFKKLVSFTNEQLNDAYLEKDKKEINKQTFRLKQMKNVLTTLKKYDEDITLNNIKEVSDLPGVGKGTIQRITEILQTGKLSELDGFSDEKDTRKKILEELQLVINIGRSNAVELVDKYKVKSVADLKKKHKKGEIELNDKILLGLKYHGVYQENIPRDEIKKVNKFLNRVVRKMNKQYRLDDSNKFCLIICGSFRRKKPFSGDIDVLLTKFDSKRKDTKKNSTYLPHFVHKLKKPRRQNDNKPFLLDDMTDKNIVTKYMGFSKYLDNPVRRIDIRFIPYDSYHTATLYFTGSGELNKKMRQIAKDQGYKLSEYELSDIKTKKKIKVNSEEDIFKKLGMDYIKPEFR